MADFSEEQVRAMVRRVLARTLGGTTPGTTPSTRPLVDASTLAALAPGERYVVPPNAIVTPLARDHARDRGITLVEGQTALQPQVSGGGTRHIALGADHGGYTLKEGLKQYLTEHLNCQVHDVGPFDAKSVDYPDYAYAVATLVSGSTCEVGIMIDGVGIGSCMAANKVPGVRAAMCYDISTARNAREHNHANVLTLGGQLIGPLLAQQIVKTWLETPFGPDRHAKRVAKIMEIEARYTS